MEQVTAQNVNKTVCGSRGFEYLFISINLLFNQCEIDNPISTQATFVLSTVMTRFMLLTQKKSACINLPLNDKEIK